MWPLPILALLYWDARRLVPYSLRLARIGILSIVALIIPYGVYSAIHGPSYWLPGMDTKLIVKYLMLLGSDCLQES